MTVTSEQFFAMQKIAYSQARGDLRTADNLRTGDILLFHSLGLGSEVTEVATHSLWSHAAFIWCLPEIDRVLLLESMDTVGVRVMPMSTRINGCSAQPTPYQGGLLVLRHEDFPSDPDPLKINAMTKFALDRVGFPYSFWELHRIVVRIVLGLAGKIVTGRLDPKNQFICSEYVAKCYDVIGIELAPNQEGFIAPGDVAADLKIHARFSLRPDVESPELQQQQAPSR